MISKLWANRANSVISVSWEHNGIITEVGLFASKLRAGAANSQDKGCARHVGNYVTLPRARLWESTITNEGWAR